MENLKILLCLLFLGVCHGQLFVREAKDSWTYMESPGYAAGRLPWSSNMVWYMKPETRGNLLYLDFLDFSIEGEEPCEKNFMEIYDSGTVRGRFCTNTSFSMLSFGPWVELRLKWETGVQGRGFRLRYKQVPPEHPRGSLGCDVTLNLKDENFPTDIFSPNYPGIMARGTNCSWEITAPPGLRIKITGRYLRLSDCNAYLALFEDSVEAARFCGGDSEEFVTNKNHTVLVTRSDHVEAAFWIQAEATRDPSSIYGSCPSKGQMASLVATKQVSTIASLNYEISNYVNYMECYWVIRAEDPDHTVQVSLVNPAIQDSVECSRDFLAGYDGPDISGPWLFKWCGNQNANATSLSNTITLVFQSDCSVQHEGFLLQYTMGPARTSPQNNAAMITGVVCALIAVIIVAACLSYCLARRRKAAREAERHNTVELRTWRQPNKKPGTPDSTGGPSHSTPAQESLDTISIGDGVENQQNGSASGRSSASPRQDGNGPCVRELTVIQEEEEAEGNGASALELQEIHVEEQEEERSLQLSVEANIQETRV